MICIVSDFHIYFTENFEKRSHHTPDMASILAATSTTRRKGLKFSSVATKQIRDQVEKISKEVAGHEEDGLPLVNYKGKSKVRNKGSWPPKRVSQWLPVHRLVPKPQLGRS